MLEYKASGAIGEWTDSRRNELAKDICAFANSAGGIIIIGIAEENHKPHHIDDGVDTRLASKEAIESALQARITPRVDGMSIKEIPNPEQPFFSYFVLGIPRSMRAPHMCVPFHRYYKRYNFECVPMEHYEVEDVRRRQSEPVLVFTCRLEPLESVGETHRLYALSAGVINEGSVTARDVLVRVYLPGWTVGEITWSPNDAHTQMAYNNEQMHRFDAYLRDGAGPIPVFPKDDQPYPITRGKSRRIILRLPAGPSRKLDSTHLIVQLFAENMRMRSFEVPLGKLLTGPYRGDSDDGNSHKG